MVVKEGGGNSFSSIFWILQPVDGGGQSGSGNAEKDVHPPGQSVYGRAVDAEGGLVPQVETHQQHFW